MLSTQNHYNDNIDAIRETEYPMLQGATYLDHAGTTLYAKSLVDSFASSMISGLYGNPHSTSSSSILSSKRIDDVRLRALRFVNADPEKFDLVFVANATAGIKLVLDGFRACQNGFSYYYHRDSHTSLVGVREGASRSRCLRSDEEVDGWMVTRDSEVEATVEMPGLFAYPGQSNMNGRRLPLSWANKIRQAKRHTYTLFDAAALVSTSQLDLSNSDQAPDFTVLSFYKIFGFPNLGALVVRKPSGSTLTKRKYFGGGTVDMVSCIQEQWHMSKDQSIHEQLEDGTLPIHSILALDSALDAHQRIYKSMGRISEHTMYLASELYKRLSSLQHSNGRPVCKIYTNSTPQPYGDSRVQGPVIAFNIQDSNGMWVSNSEVEKLATIKNIHLRTGGLCNPGGIAHHLDLEPWEMKRNFSAGQRCGNDNEGIGGKPTGVIRVSLGAMSNMTDVNTFTAFIKEFFVEQMTWNDLSSPILATQNRSCLFIESLTVYPIKSCGGYVVPPDTSWEVKEEGLAWDREWCLVHSGTGKALSQKKYPQMALLKPDIDLKEGLLRVRFYDHDKNTRDHPEICIPLFSGPSTLDSRPSNVCTENIEAYPYFLEHVTEFFTTALGVPCHLARFPAGGSGLSQRHSKAHLQQHQLKSKSQPMHPQLLPALPSTPPPSPPSTASEPIPRSILLSNESPILCITRFSIDFLNSQITRKGGKPAHHSVFRANIVIGSSSPTVSIPYIEDTWTHLRVGEVDHVFEMLGSCRRCSMVCVDQDTAERNEEPFVTLAKTRRFDNKVFFGEHMCCVKSSSEERVYIRVGDSVKASCAE
ncbi:pyridoxal phosphate-dependent transferase [Xylogone sp. PMI_703]|nr:pyridoxal phosphate-dependent transferase [Xylogone sp. PMI_703]